MFKVITRGDDREWNRVIDAMPYDLRDVHWTVGYARAYETLYPGSLACMAIEECPNYIVAQPFLLRRGPSDITGIGYGGPIANDPIPNRETGARFDHLFKEWQKANSVLSNFYLSNPIFEQEQFYLAHDIDVHREQTVVVVATDESMKMSHGRSSDLWAARDFIVTEGPGAGPSFESLYRGMMQRYSAAERWHLPTAYFEAINEILWPQTTVLRTHGAAVLILFGKSVAYYHLAASQEDAPCGASTILVITAMRKAKERGCRWLLLGGGLTNKPDDSLLAFKRSFGGICVPLWSRRDIVDFQGYWRETEAQAKNVWTPGSHFFPAYRSGEAA